jgi:hypothetical protein
MRLLVLSIVMTLMAFASCESSKTNSDNIDAAVENKGRTLSGAYRLDIEEAIFLRVYEGEYFTQSAYSSKNGNFISTYGGTWQLDSSSYIENVEFDSDDSTNVGLTKNYDLRIDKNGFSLEGSIFSAVDTDIDTDLKGAWFIAGRERDGEMAFREPSPRKTMKILSGTRFQWVAYDVDKKGFYGTGGGTYSSDNGEYVENIEFFSRDSTRVGASLNFGFEVKGNDWHHKGLSSKGDSIYEVWRK